MESNNYCTWVKASERLPETAKGHLSQLFSPVSDELQLLRERLEAAEKVFPWLNMKRLLEDEGNPYLDELKEAHAKWQQLKHKSK